MDVPQLVENQSAFTLDLFRKAVQKSGENAGNAVMSPISLVTVLAMAGAGAKGETLAQLTSVLRLPEGKAMHEFTSQVKLAAFADGTIKGGPFVSFANGLWVEKSVTLKPKFQELVKESYRAEVKAADFVDKAEEERTIINSWVSDETKEKIRDLLPPNSLNAMTKLVLANALYFKGKWAKQFETEDTKNGDFHLLNGETVSVPFLTSREKQNIQEFDTFTVLNLPYVSGDDKRCFSMYFVLPHDKAGLPELEKNLDAKSLTEHCSWTNREVPVGKFLLPKFKISTAVAATELLVSMGLKAPFSQGADFSDMVEGPNADLLSISDVFHKSFIEVNEEGTEAAAASAVVVTFKSLTIPLSPPDFVADHPFLFILKEDVTGVILFIGRMTNPSLSE